jgi:ATP-binding cassette subfamily F protein 2
VVGPQLLRLRGAGPKKKPKKQSKPSVNLNFAAALENEDKQEKATRKGVAAGDDGSTDPAGAKSTDALDMSEIKSALTKLDDNLPVVTGVLATHEGSRDIKIEQFTLEVYGKPLVTDSVIEFNYGRR